jgi:hypothetical protein
MSFPLCRIEVVEGQLEGLTCSVMIYVITEVCHLCTYAGYFNRNRSIFYEKNEMNTDY